MKRTLTKKARILLELRREVRDAPAEIVERTAVIVRGREPFREWKQQCLRDAGAPPIPAGELESVGVYLLPEVEMLEEFDALLKQNWRRIFENELVDWALDQSEWPQPRTRALFDRRFEVTCSDYVADLEGGRIRKTRW